MSIFKETFKSYVRQQLSIRESIITSGNKLSDKRFGIRTAPNVISGGEVNLPPGAFYTYTAEKQCMIRMASGVDLETSQNILEAGKYEKVGDLLGAGLAMRYMLMGGVPIKNYDFKKNRPERLGGPELPEVPQNEIIQDAQDPFDNAVTMQLASRGMARKKGSFGKHYSATYGDPYIRSDADPFSGFGIVPMPGITSLNVRTKSAYGSLREAKVEFSCHNKRQLEILELLYMRPGFPILIDWGWSVYFNNRGQQDTYFPFIEKFWHQDTKMDEINSEILRLKSDSAGNYDGFLGMCKNFEFIARSDGGFDCTTEIIGAGEVIESLKGRRTGKRISKVEQSETAETDRRKKVEVDDLEYYIASILQFASTQTKRVSDVNYTDNNPYDLGLLADFREFAVSYATEQDGTVEPTFKIEAGEFRELAREQSRSDNPDSIFSGPRGTDLNDDIDEIERLIDPYYIYKGEPLFRGTTELENAMESKEHYIRWDFFSHILNMYVINKQGTSKEPIFHFTNKYNGTTIPLKYHKVNLTKRIQEERTYQHAAEGYSATNNDPSIVELSEDIFERVFETDYTEDLNARQVKIDELVDMSTDPLIGLLPHQITKFLQRSLDDDAYDVSLSPVGPSSQDMHRDAIVSAYVKGNREIGNVFFNIQHIKNVYEGMRYNDEGLNPEFNLFDFVKKLWDDLNTACAGTHNFTLQSEHERPNKVRIIDLGFQIDSKLNKEDIYEFKIQSNESICRDFNFNTTIPNSLSSTISIAAQNPDAITDLEAASFSALHKNIRSRFFPEKTATADEKERKAKKYDEDVEDFENDLVRLYMYRIDVLSGDYTLVAEERKVGRINKNKAISIIKGLESKIVSLNARFNKTDETADPPQYKGFRNPDYSQGRSEIIPIKFNAKLDGISGLVIGNVFKVDKTRLPKGYQGDDIAFVVMGESQNVNGQDWTTEITGQLVLLDLSPKIGEPENTTDEDNISQMERLINENPFEEEVTELDLDEKIRKFHEQGKMDIVRKKFYEITNRFYNTSFYQVTKCKWTNTNNDSSSPWGKGPEGYAWDIDENYAEAAVDCARSGPYNVKALWDYFSTSGTMYANTNKFHNKPLWVWPGNSTRTNIAHPTFIDFRDPPSGVLNNLDVEDGWVNFGKEGEGNHSQLGLSEDWSHGIGTTDPVLAQWLIECFCVGDQTINLFPGHFGMITNRENKEISYYEDIFNIRMARISPMGSRKDPPAAGGGPFGGGALNLPIERRYMEMTLQELINWTYIYCTYLWAMAVHSGNIKKKYNCFTQADFIAPGTGENRYPGVPQGTPPSGTATSLKYGNQSIKSWYESKGRRYVDTWVSNNDFEYSNVAANRLRDEYGIDLRATLPSHYFIDDPAYNRLTWPVYGTTDYWGLD